MPDFAPALATAKGHYDGTHVILDAPLLRRPRPGQEVTITFAMDPLPPPAPRRSRHDLVALLRGSVKDTGKTLEEFREERLKKYET